MSGIALEHDAVTGRIIGAAIEVHRCLGPGLLESVYEACLADECARLGMECERQVVLPVEYKGRRMEAGLRIDLLVERAVVVEVKAVDTLQPIHEAQLLTYLRLSGHTVGLLINFNVEVLRQGIRRRVLSSPNPLPSSAPSAPPR